MSRGKLLHSGMHSLKSFQPAADSFCSWLSEIESSMEGLEIEASRLSIKYNSKEIPPHEMKRFKVSSAKFGHQVAASASFLPFCLPFKPDSAATYRPNGATLTKKNVFGAAFSLVLYVYALILFTQSWCYRIEFYVVIAFATRWCLKSSQIFFLRGDPKNITPCSRTLTWMLKNKIWGTKIRCYSTQGHDLE